MATETTLTPADYAVFSRIPAEWLDENFVSCEIAQAIEQRTGVVMRRVSRLVALGLVERRAGARVAAQTEIRRVGK